jgi:hypothetical protein
VGETRARQARPRKGGFEDASIRSALGRELRAAIHGVGRLVAEAPVETTQIAPTILQLLGLDPNALQAVQIEHTAPLPVR